MEVNERILAIVKEKGPILPVQIAKEINDNILMASARLSELLSAKQIKISNLKVGGSPLYYFTGQESKLQNFTDNLHGKPKDAYNLLKQDKILRDSAQEPAIRVALREIKDFAVPLQVNYKNNVEIFWKWYLTDNKEAELLIKNILSKKEFIPETQETQRVSGPQKSKGFFREPKEEVKKEATPKPLGKTEPKKEVPIELKKDTTKIKKKIDKGKFLEDIQNFLNKAKINIIETKEIKKNNEIDFIVELQTQLGNIRYFCKTKNKKKISEGDLSSALLNAQSKNLPLLFLTTGKATKKSKEKLGTDFKNIVYREI